MKFTNDIQRKVQEFASENATTLLTAGGVVGVVGTGVLAWRGGYKYHQIIAEAQQEKMVAVANTRDEGVEHIDEHFEASRLSKTEKVVKAVPDAAPPVVLGGFTIAMIVMSHRMSAQKAAALAAAYGLSRQQFEEYKAKVAEKLTGPKQEQVNAELAQERANRAPGADKIVIVDGNDVLCFDQVTGRYFKSSMEKINKAVNRTNEEALNSEYASLNFFYEELGLPPTSMGDEIGFYRGHLVALDFDTILSPEDDSTPVLTINFKNMPTEHFIRKAHEY
jgi:hypothetical protein